MESIRTFAEITTFHGLSDLFSTKSWTTRIIWVSFLLGSLGYLSYQMSEAFVEYGDQPTSFRIKTLQIDKIPNITICPSLAVNESRAKDLGFDQASFAYFKSLWFWEHLWPYRAESTINGKQAFYDIMKTKGMDTLQQLTNELAFSESNFKDYSQTQKPNRLTGWLGYCYLFSNHTYGDQVFIEMEHFISKTKPWTNKLANITSADTVMIIAGNSIQNTIPRQLTIQPKIVKLVEVSVMHHKFLNTAQKPCYSKENVELELIPCRLACKNTVLESNFNCTMYEGENPLPLKYVCNEYIREEYYSGMANTYEKIQSKCFERCLPCQHWEYDLAVTEEFKDESESTAIVVALKGSSRIIAYFEEYYIYSWTTFIGNVGGLLSLFTGASVLTICHTVYFCLYKIVLFTGQQLRFKCISPRENMKIVDV